MRWTGQVQPQFSDTYFFDVRSDDGCRLWVNDQLLIDKWQTQGATDWTNALALQAGVRYDLRLDYLQSGASARAHLSWYSADQAEEIIPTACLYPSNSVGNTSSNAPAVVTSALSAVAFLGQPFSFTVTAANTPLGFTANGLPPGLTFNNTNGAHRRRARSRRQFPSHPHRQQFNRPWRVGRGHFGFEHRQFRRSGNLDECSRRQCHRYPDGHAGQPHQRFGRARRHLQLRGQLRRTHSRLFHRPGHGQLLFLDRGQRCGAALDFRRQPASQPGAALLGRSHQQSNHAGAKWHGPQQWNVQASQQSPWLALVAGQQYYLEVLHKAGAGAGDNWSVGWMQDPTGTNTTPAGVVPGYLLSRYYPPLPANTPGTLYTANLLALPGVVSQGVGSATLRVSADGSQAALNYSDNNLSGAPTGQSINSDPYLSDPGELIFDISAAKPQADGSYLWKIKATGPLAAPDILEIINEGKAAIVIETTAFANGEIGGHFTLANGSQTFSPPPPPPAWTDDSANASAAARFLTQATFGASSNDIAAVQALGYSNWLANQFSLPATHCLSNVLANPNSDPTDLYQSPLWFNTWWRQSITAPDQLRQRVAFALSEIFVVSENGTLQNHADALSSYYDMLLDHAFGNYRSLLEAVTLHPSMGLYLGMLGNDAGSIITGIHANENYAREVQQLFSIGLNRQWPDGTLILNAQDNLVPTYNQNVVMGFASVFTGWNYYQTNQANGRLPSNWYPGANYTNPMVLVPAHHELGAKLLLDNVMLPPAWGGQAVSSASNDAYCSQDLESALEWHLQQPERRPVHLPSTHPAPGHQQSRAGIMFIASPRFSTMTAPASGATSRPSSRRFCWITKRAART